MFKRLLLTLTFKAVLALGTMLGMASFGLYLSGGNPGAVWSRVGGGVVASIGETASSAGNRIAAVAGSARSLSGDALSAVGGNGDSADSGSTRVWTWQDENGVTHYTNAPPPGQATSTILVDPNVNVLAPVSAPVATPVASADESSTGRSRAAAAGTGTSEDDALPGIAGAFQQMPGGGDQEQAQALLKLLQGARITE